VGRILLLVTTPRLPAGLLTAAAWDTVRAHPVLSASDGDQVRALRSSGVDVSLTGESDAVTAVLTAVAEHGTVVWLAGPAGDEDFARALGLRLTRQPGLATMELQYGSWDPVGARLLDMVTTIDRMVSPGGDPWKHEQTHQSLGRYLLEEAYEAYDAIDAHDLDALREELGDVLLQVVLHSRMAQDAPAPWSIDDLAGDAVDKMVRRNPHVFAGESVTGMDEILANWNRIKAAEKARESSMDGIALSQPALSLAEKILSRARTAGIPPDILGVAPATVEESPVDLFHPPRAGAIEDEDDLGAALFDLVAAGYARGLDPEAALRRVALARAQAVRAAETAPGV
jgi:XTP/dITP diphosphohydrolase